MLICTRGEKYEYTDPETGEKFFSISQVRDVMWNDFANVKPEVKEAGGRRGKRLHYYFALHLGWIAGLRLDPPKPVDGYEGYCTGIVAALDELMPPALRQPTDVIRIEDPGCNPILGVAGTPECLLLTVHKGKKVLTLPDLKTGGTTRTDWTQLLAYKTFEDYTEAKRLIDIYVHEDGTKKIEDRGPNPHDWAAFLNALNLLKWRTAR